MKYFEFLQYLENFADKDFAAFQRKLIPTKQKILGVRTPTMREIAKLQATNIEEICSYPSEVYEVTFIKLTILSQLEYSRFLECVQDCVSEIDNWAICDSFKAKCIRSHKEEFLSVLERLFQRGREFDQRYVLVTLLSFYVENKYEKILEKYLRAANTQFYYVHMAAAWLMAEILIKEYDLGVKLLKMGFLDVKTHNKAIQKSRESYRLTNEQKEYLKSLKK